MSESTAVTAYVLQCRHQGSDAWTDLSRRDTPEEAFARRDIFRAAWDRPIKEGLQGLQVVRRVTTDTVIEDPRPAPGTREAEAVT